VGHLPVFTKISRQTIAATNPNPAIICKIIMASILPHTDEGWFKFFQNIYILALVVTVLATLLVTRYANRVTTNTALQIARANERAAQLERENLEIKQKMAWRTLAGETRTAFINSVKGYGHSITIVQLQDGEAWNYSEQIFSAFKAAGWMAGKNYRQLYDPGGVPQGVICRISTNPDAIVQMAIKSLEQAGAKPNVLRESHLRPDQIEVTVGLKPIA
jgi:hypothetical protein